MGSLVFWHNVRNVKAWSPSQSLLSIEVSCMISILRVFSVLFCFFAVDLIILPTRFLVYTCCGGSFFSLKALFLSLFSQILLDLGRDFSLPTWVLLGFWEGFVSFFTLEVLFLSDRFCSSGIYIPSKVGFSSKSGSIVDVLEVMFLKIFRFLIQITLF